MGTINNKNNKVFVYTSILLVVLMTGSFLLRINKIEKSKEKFYKTCVSLMHTRTLLLEEVSTVIANQGLEINPIKCYDLKGEVSELMDLINNKKNLIFSFNPNKCHTCINMIINKTKEHVDTTTIKNKFLILSSFTSDTIMKSFIDSYQIDTTTTTVFNIKDQKFGLPVEEKNVPFFFVVDSTMRTRYFCVPFNKEPKILENYFNSIVKYF